MYRAGFWRCGSDQEGCVPYRVDSLVGKKGINSPARKYFTTVAINTMEKHKVPLLCELRRLSRNGEGSFHS